MGQREDTGFRVLPAFCAICRCILMVNQFISCWTPFLWQYTLQMFYSVIPLQHNLTGKHNKSYDGIFCMLFPTIEHKDKKKSQSKGSFDKPPITFKLLLVVPRWVCWLEIMPYYILGTNRCSYRMCYYICCVHIIRLCLLCQEKKGSVQTNTNSGCWYSIMH